MSSHMTTPSATLVILSGIEETPALYFVKESPFGLAAIMHPSLVDAVSPEERILRLGFEPTSRGESQTSAAEESARSADNAAALLTKAGVSFQRSANNPNQLEVAESDLADCLRELQVPENDIGTITAAVAEEDSRLIHAGRQAAGTSAAR